jgi:hypothetical protein
MIEEAPPEIPVGLSHIDQVAGEVELVDPGKVIDLRETDLV